MKIRLILTLICLNVWLGACTVNTTPIIDRSGMYKDPPTVTNKPTPPSVSSADSVGEQKKPTVVTSDTTTKATPVTSPPSTVVEAPACSDDPTTPSGFYKVRPKENLYRIALCKGKSYEDLARWNNLEDANQIKVGQLIRLSPPDGQSAVSPTATAAKPAVKTEEPKVDMVKLTSNDAMFIWPYKGKIINKFNGVKNKGVDIAGQVGDPVFSAAGGKVVYVGNELKGLGNLVIVKHNETYVTAYANNSAVLVQEGQQVTQGQAIAKVGSSGTDRVQLHFEIRKNGAPVDPETLLPK